MADHRDRRPDRAVEVAASVAPDVSTVVHSGLDACTVLHVDLDAFFAAVEVLDDPTLAGRPVIVGGSGNRGVVAACTYEARVFGIHSAMSSVEARRRCPHAVFLVGRFSRYAEVSERFHAVLHGFTPVVEPIALDEAFLDVSGVRRILGSPVVVARAIRSAVRRELRLDCAVGVARTKLVAKLASRAAKPSVTASGPRPGPGVVAVAPDEELAFLHPLPVRALWGVGPTTARRLDGLGVSTVGELAVVPVDTVCRVLGTAHGRHLAALARGEDARVVVPGRDVKSVGHEETFAVDLHRHDAAHAHLVRMADAVGTRLREARLQGRTITLKVRHADHTTVTRSHTVATVVDSPRAIGEVAGALLGAVDISAGIRLLGVSVSGLAPVRPEARQLSFDDAPPFDGRRHQGPSFTSTGPGPTNAPLGAHVPGETGREGEVPGHGWAEVEAAVSAIRARYGHASVGPATLIGEHGLDVKRRGDAQWGPSDPSDGGPGPP